MNQMIMCNVVFNFFFIPLTISNTYSCTYIVLCLITTPLKIVPITLIYACTCDNVLTQPRVLFFHSPLACVLMFSFFTINVCEFSAAQELICTT